MHNEIIKIKFFNKYLIFIKFDIIDYAFAPKIIKVS